ncbi:MAG: type II secretion system F family protein [Gammaproteobacteria bacterium]|nr:type II secretion system F family protein [Gammaproteobacteria bacterium]MBY0544647.1 type II secretion system F family protein [Gammaproteobacteria bacterium]
MAARPPSKPALKLKKTKAKPPFDLSNAIEKLTFGTTEQQAFLEDLATLVDDGVPANKAIAVIGRVEKGPKRNVADYIGMKIAQGKAIADGMGGWFSPAVIELVRAGEQGGTLGQNIRMAAESMGKKSETFASLASSLTYPLVVLIAGCGVLIYMNHSVFPQFESIKPIADWPSNGQNLVAIANFLQDWWYLVVAGLIGFAVAAGMAVRNLVGETRAALDKIYGFTIYRQLAAARFMETMGLLIANGVVFKQALKILEQQASPYLSWHLMIMELKLSRGRGNIAEVLDTGLISDEDIVRLKAIADAKGFEHALIRLGKAAGERGVQMVRKVGRILGGVFLALAGGFAGYMVMGLYSVGSSLS